MNNPLEAFTAEVAAFLANRSLRVAQQSGFEWGTGFYINPTPPEEAARFLREASVEEPATVTG